MDAKNGRFSVANILSFPYVLRNDGQFLQTVLNNMSQGVLLFDSELKLVVCNHRYIEMYGLSPESVKPGCALRDLLNSRIQVGTFSGDPVDYVARLEECINEGKVFSNTTRLTDGRFISLVNKPIFGGGWLSTHEDITERQCAEERIGHMARHDALTDLPNRVLLRERLEHELKRVKRGECSRSTRSRSISRSFRTWQMARSRLPSSMPWQAWPMS
jgi:hypothetical protein